MVKIQDKLTVANESLEYFKLTEFKFDSKNVDKLQSSMNKEDANNFQIDVKRINWTEYFEGYVLGIRQYVFKQNSSTIGECKKRLFR